VGIQEKIVNNKSILIFRFVVSIGILGALFYWLPADEILRGLLSLPATTWLLVIAVFLAGHVVAAMKWRYLLGRTGVETRIDQIIKAHSAGLFANICLPSIVGGDVVRAGLLHRDTGQLAQITAASLFDRLIDTFTLILIAAIAAFSLGKLPQIELSSSTSAILLVAIGMAAVTALALKYKLFGKFTRVLEKLAQPIRLLVSQPLSAFVALGMSLGIQSLFILINIFIARQLGIDVPWPVWFFCWPVAKLIALVPISLGGIGVRDAALVSLLSFYGVAHSNGFTQSLAWQSTLIISGVLAGMFAWIAAGKTLAFFNENTVQLTRNDLNE